MSEERMKNGAMKDWASCEKRQLVNAIEKELTSKWVDGNAAQRTQNKLIKLILCFAQVCASGWHLRLHLDYYLIVEIES